MKNLYIISFIVLCVGTSFWCKADAKHLVQFIIQRHAAVTASTSANVGSNPYSIELKLISENAAFITSSKFPELHSISFSRTQKIKEPVSKQDFELAKNFRFDYSSTQDEPNKKDEQYKLQIDSFNSYVRSEIINQIFNPVDNYAQLNITLNMYEPQNDFTRPYKELYLKIKKLCHQMNITIQEPSLTPKVGFYENPKQWFSARWLQLKSALFNWHW